ncbi:MAG: hypothetical protein JXB49_13210 [Bacteroidales bacterium]|nr:hypothetical protein [Bacteroidales bacterium]
MSEKVSVGSILVGIYIFSVPVFSYSGELGLNLVPQIIGTTLVIYAIYYIIISGSVIKNTPIIFYLLFAIWSIISFAFSDYPNNTDTLVTLLKVSIITISTAVLIKTRKDFVISMSLFFLSIFITFWLNYEDIIGLTMGEASDVNRFAGTFANANTASLYSIAIIWVGLTITVTIKIPKVAFVILILGILIAFSIVLYSGSRKGLIGIILIAISLIWIINRKYGRTNLRSIFILLALSVGLFFLLRLIYNSLFFYRVINTISGDDTYTRNNMFNQAIIIWSKSLKNTLMGIGIGNFKYYYIYPSYSHSTISETLVCSGLIGFGLYFISLGSVFIQSYKTYKVTIQQEKIQVLLIFIFISLVFMFNIGAVLHNDRLFWPLIGIISAHSINLRRLLPQV